MTSPAFGRFFLPGPTDVHPDVLAAMERPIIGHRSSAMEQLMGGMTQPLGRLFRTSRPVLVGTASATDSEMAVRNGGRAAPFPHHPGRRSGKECIRPEVPLGSAVEPDLLRDALRRTPVDAVTPCTGDLDGVLQDVAALAAVVLRVRQRARSWTRSSLLLPPVEHDRWGLTCHRLAKGARPPVRPGARAASERCRTGETPARARPISTR
jgi:aspartate aminotransferase-like enzyme